PDHAGLQHRGDELAPRRDRRNRRARCPRHPPGRSSRLALVHAPPRAGQYHHHCAAAEVPRAQPGREHLAVHARQLALQPHLQLLRRSRRPLLCGMEQARRPALAHHVHRTAPMDPRVLINGIWYKSSDQLLSLIRETVKKFDEENIVSSGSEYFIQNAPAAIADTLRYRANCERQLPQLVCRMISFGRSKEGNSEFYRRCRADAIKFYLLRANFLGHWKLGYLSSWEGLSSLNLRAPNAWVPYQGMSSDKFYPLLYDEKES